MHRFGHELDAISKDHKKIFNRLKSIQEDAAFVDEVADTYPGLAIIANERCGSWYINHEKHPQAGSAYFKSTDGHMGQWDFSVRRANLPLVGVIVQHGGALIVDSTRRGKRIPDALAKTIPIWCCTLNRAVQRYRQQNGISWEEPWDDAFYTQPSAVSRSEHAQIETRIDAFVEKLWTYGVDLALLERQLRKPMRPFWLTPESNLACAIEIPDAYPVFCVSASQFIQDGGCQVRPAGYLYVQGSGDDHEEWSMGLSARLFWRHASSIVAHVSTCEETVRAVVLQEQEARQRQGQVSATAGGVAHAIQKTGIVIGDAASARQWWQSYDAVIRCCAMDDVLAHDDATRARSLDLAIPEGKRGQHVLEKAIPTAIAFAQPFLAQGKRVLVFSVDGKDRAVGIALALFVRFYDEQGGWQLTAPRMATLSKETIRLRLVQLLASHPQAAPSRVTLRRVNTFFLSPNQ
ncbi:initiator tRNA phosphoribosyl transferase [Gongronella butleri]|nr:initiator tRNA phosphoribosyl transferase [Gongronella butleri]